MKYMLALTVVTMLFHPSYAVAKKIDAQGILLKTETEVVTHCEFLKPDFAPDTARIQLKTIKTFLRGKDPRSLPARLLPSTSWEPGSSRIIRVLGRVEDYHFSGANGVTAMQVCEEFEKNLADAMHLGALNNGALADCKKSLSGIRQEIERLSAVDSTSLTKQVKALQESLGTTQEGAKKAQGAN
jgi:hypothetical protein